MKILIVSDSHGRDDNLKLVIDKYKPFDMLIHLGDIEGSEYYIPEWVNPDCRIEMVRGNNDFSSNLDINREIMIEGHKVLLTHGHYYSVRTTYDSLANAAKSRGCDTAIFGHTHKPFIGEVNGVMLINPGSISYPRQEGRKPSYIILNTDPNGKFDLDLEYLKPRRF